jgi:hypothetical protein
MYGQEKLQVGTMNYKREWLLPKSLMGSRMGFWRRSKLGFVSIFKSCLLPWIVRDYRASGFGMASSYSRSSSSCLSFEGPADWSLVFFNFLTLWLLVPTLKLESVEVGLSRCASSNFSLNLHFDYGVLSSV